MPKVRQSSLGIEYELASSVMHQEGDITVDYYRRIEERDVWVTVLKPFVWDEKSNTYQQSTDYCSAFKFDQPVVMIAGEFIRDASKKDDMKWFGSPDEAANAAFEEAKKKMKANAQENT